MNFSDLQNILKEKLGIEHLADVARELGVSPQAVSNWKARDKVPYKYVSKIRNQLLSPKVDSDDNFSNKNRSTVKEFHDRRDSNYIEDDIISVTDILLVIAKHIRTILIIPSIISICTIFYTIIYLEPVYESSAKIMSSSGVSNISQVTGLAAQFGLSIPTESLKI